MSKINLIFNKTKIVVSILILIEKFQNCRQQFINRNLIIVLNFNRLIQNYFNKRLKKIFLIQ